jgi:hypothetical protein
MRAAPPGADDTLAGRERTQAVKNQPGTMRWSVRGDDQALRDIAVDFLDGRDDALDELNRRNAHVRVRPKEIVVTVDARAEEAWLLERFSRRHPGAIVEAVWSATPQEHPVHLGHWRNGALD